MAKGIDCATPLTMESAAAFKADGMDFVCRYFPLGYTKSLTLSEANTTSNAGLNIVSVFERYANRALEGYAAGLVDGRSAENAAAGVQQPCDSTIYFAVDFDVTNAEQMAAVIEYIRGCSEATPSYTTGGYGEKDVIDALAEAGACSHFWQTRAWSRGLKSEYANIYQYDCGEDGLGRLMHGIKVDLNESYGGEGWWNTLGYQMKPEDANEIIEFLKAGYGIVEDHPEAREKFRRLANELRKASGQPEE